jgi:hypothetical protein
MGVANEVLAYLQTLVWPCVAVAALIVFRRQLGALIPRIREISAAGASVKFGEQATRLADEAGRLVQGVVGGQAAAAHHLPELLRPAPVVDPTVVFLEAYQELEATARDAGPAADVMAPTPVPVIRGLARRGHVPQEAVQVAEDLRRIRNEVAHGARRLEPVDAENLAITARSLAAMCRWAGQSQKPPASVAAPAAP